MKLNTLAATALALTTFALSAADAQTTVRREVREEVRAPGAVAREEVRVAGAPARGVLVLPTDTLVRIKLMDTLDSKNWKEGDRFPYEVSQDVIIDGQPAIPAGTKGAGVITEARKAGAFGRSGKLEMSFGTLPVSEGRTVELVLSERAREGNKKENLAAGASLAGLAVAGPIGLVGGLFIKGKNVSIPAGSELYVATAGSVELAPGSVHRTTTTITR